MKIYKNYYILIILSLTVLFAFTANQDWYRFRGPNGSSIVDDEININKLKGDPKIIYTMNIGSGYSAVSIKDNYLYTVGYGSGNDTIYCFNISNNKLVWKYSYSSQSLDYNGPRSTPYINGDYVYSISQDGKIFCLFKDNGRVIWQKNFRNDFNVSMPKWGFAGSPVVEGELLLINANSYGLALNKNTGNKVWSSPSGVCGYSTPVVFNYNNEKHMAIFSSDKINIVALNSGKRLCYYTWTTSYDVNAADPLIIDNNKIFITSGYGKGCTLLKINVNKLESLWTNTNIASHFSSMIYHNGYIYGVSGNSGSRAGFTCINVENGKVMWNEGLGYGSFILAGSNFLYLTEKGKLYICKLDSTKYNETANCSFKGGLYWTAPVINKGMLFIRNANKGELYCVDIE